MKLSSTILDLFFIVLDKGKNWKGGGNNFVKKRKLNYRFHNPNPMDVTADFLLKVLIEANSEKVERAIAETALQKVGEGEYILENKKRA